jgi:hypothetical protein
MNRASTKLSSRQAPTLIGRLVSNVLPAYAFPAITTYANARLIHKADLAHAALTTIAIPSAVAALLVTVGTHLISRRSLRRRNDQPEAGPIKVGRITARAGLISLACGLALSLILIANRQFGPELLLQAPLSAAIGGATTARKWAKGRQRRATTRATTTSPSHFRALRKAQLQQASAS